MGGRLLGRQKADLMSLHRFTSEMTTVDSEGTKAPERQGDCPISGPRSKPGVLLHLEMAASTGSEQEFEAHKVIMGHVSDQFGTRKPTTAFLKAT